MARFGKLKGFSFGMAAALVILSSSCLTLKRTPAAPVSTQLKGLITEPIPTVSLDKAKSELVLSFQAGDDDMLDLSFNSAEVEGIYQSSSKVSLGPVPRGRAIVHRFPLTKQQSRAIEKKVNATILLERQAKWKAGGGATGTLTLQIDK